MAYDFITTPWQEKTSFISNPFRTADNKTHILFAQRTTDMEMADTEARKVRFLDRVIFADVCLRPDGSMERHVSGRASYIEFEDVGAETDSLWIDLS